MNPGQDLDALVKAVRRYVTEEVLPLERSEGLGWDVAPPPELRRSVRIRARELDLYAPDMPESVGGLGLSFESRCRLEMELHSLDTVFFEDVLGGGGGPSSILLAGTQEQQQRFLAPLMAGEATTCFALSEADAGSDATALQTRVQKAEGGYVLNGAKNIISNAPHANFAIVFAKAEEGISAFLVDAATPGYRVIREHNCMGFTGFQGELSFDDCRLGTDQLLGKPGRGFNLALSWINPNRIRTAAMSTGIGRGLLRRTAAFTLQRKQFGQSIATFQAVQLALADMGTELFAAESMVLAAAAMHDRGEDIRKHAAMTKLYCAEMVNRSAYQAIQLHGGAGCLKETGIERIYRMVRILTILEGTSDMQRLTIADRLLREVAGT